MKHFVPDQRPPSANAIGRSHLAVGLTVLLLTVTWSSAFNRARGAPFVPQNDALGLPTSWTSGYADSGTGVSWRDVDGDGLPDIVISAPGSFPKVYRGTAAGGLEEIPFAIAPTPPPGLLVGHTLVDVDNDADLDVLLLYRGRNLLFRNDGGMVFVDVSDTHLPGLIAPSYSAAAGDVDGDGDTDIIVANNVEFVAFPRNECAANHWLINDGFGRFEHRPPTLVEDPPGQHGCTLAVALTDVDNDGDLDLVEANDFGTFVQRNRVWRNDGGSGDAWTFTEVGEALGLGQRRFAMTAAVGDLNDDGYLDHLTTNIGRPFIAAGQPDGTFIDVTESWAGSDFTFGTDGYIATWDSRIADFDRDGYQEAIVVAGFVGGAAFLQNDELPDMVVVARDPLGEWAVNPEGWSMPKPDGGTARGMAVADMDHDGDLDVAIALTQSAPYIYRNDSAGQMPLRIALAPSLTASANGARLVASCGGHSRVREVSGGGATSGTGGVPIQFTFPPPCEVAGQPVDVLVRWPSGYVETIATFTGDLQQWQEPQWLTVTGNVMTLAPNDAEGAPAEVEDIVVTAVGADVGPPTPSGDTFEVVFTPFASSEQVVLTVEVGGTALALRPRVSLVTQAWALRWLPQYPVLGRVSTARVDLSPELNPTEVALQIGQQPLVMLNDVGGGTYAGELPAWSMAGPVDATLWVDGIIHGADKSVLVEPTTDPERSKVAFDNLHGTIGPSLTVTGQLADRNGQPWFPTLADFALLVDGQPSAGLFFETFQGSFLVSFNASTWTPGATLQLTFQDQPVGSEQTLWRGLVPAPAALDQLDVSKSWCILPRPAIRADEEDLSVLLVGLRDGGGSPVVTTESVGLAMSGLGIGPEGTLVLDAMYQFDVVHALPPGPVASPVAIEVTIGEVPTGVTCHLDLLPAAEDLPGPGEFGVASTFQAEHPVISTSDGDGPWPSKTTVTLMPRWPNERLVGSGLGVSWSTDLGTIEGGSYRGIGRYAARLVGGELDGLATVTATTAAGESWSVEVAIESSVTGDPELGPEEGPEPGPEAGPEESPEPLEDTAGTEDAEGSDLADTTSSEVDAALDVLDVLDVADGLDTSALDGDAQDGQGPDADASVPADGTADGTDGTADVADSTGDDAGMDAALNSDLDAFDGGEGLSDAATDSLVVDAAPDMDGHADVLPEDTGGPDGEDALSAEDGTDAMPDLMTPDPAPDADATADIGPADGVLLDGALDVAAPVTDTSQALKPQPSGCQGAPPFPASPMLLPMLLFVVLYWNRKRRRVT